MQHNLTCLHLKRKMTIRKNAKILTVFAFHWWGWGLGWLVCSFVFAAFITSDKAKPPKPPSIFFSPTIQNLLLPLYKISHLKMNPNFPLIEKFRVQESTKIVNEDKPKRQFCDSCVEAGSLLCTPNAGALVQPLVRELDPTCHNSDPAQSNKYFLKRKCGAIKQHGSQ